MKIQSFTFFSTHHIHEEAQFRKAFHRHSLHLASKVINWKTVSNTSSKKQTLNRAQTNKDKNIALGALTPCVSHQHKCT